MRLITSAILSVALTTSAGMAQAGLNNERDINDGLLVLAVAQFIEVERVIVLASTAGLALLSVILVAVTVGAMIPILLERIGVDPALATGVFITTGNDILSVALFFLLMTTFYL